jgi:hypothetical protein
VFVALVEYIILHNPPLAIEIIEDSKLDKMSLYLTAINTFAKLSVSCSKGVVPSSNSQSSSAIANQLNFELYRTDQFLKAVRVGFSWENINSDFIILTVLFLL